MFLLTAPRRWIMFVIYVSCFSCFLVWSLQPCWHLLGKANLLVLLYAMFSCVLPLFDVVFWVGCGAWLYRFLIVAFFLTHTQWHQPITGLLNLIRNTQLFLFRFCKIYFQYGIINQRVVTQISSNLSGKKCTAKEADMPLKLYIRNWPMAFDLSKNWYDLLSSFCLVCENLKDVLR